MPRTGALRSIVALTLLTAGAAAMLACAARPVRPPSTPAEVERATERSVSLARAIASRPRASGEDLAFAGWLLWMHAGDAEPAAELFERALRVDPSAPLARLGLGRLARARLDDDLASEHFLRILAENPGDPVAELAAGFLSWTLGSGPEMDEHAADVLRAVEVDDRARPGLRLAARSLLAERLEASGDDLGYVSLVSAGAPKEWTVLGPFSRFHSLEPAAGEEILTTGEIGERHQGPLGEILPWTEPAPEGSLELLGVPQAGDVYFAAVDLLVPEEGSYDLVWDTRSQVRVVISGVEVLHRDPLEGSPPSRGVVGLHLAEGRHRLVMRLLSGVGGGAAAIRILDSEGRPAEISHQPAAGEAPDSWWTPATAELGSSGGRRFGRRSQNSAEVPPSVTVEERRTFLEELRLRFAPDPSGALAIHLAAEHLWYYERDHAKELLDTLLSVVPAFAPTHYLAAQVAYGDPALPPELRRGRASAAAKRAAALDPLHGWARLMAASIAVEQDRFDEASDLLDEAQEVAPLSLDLIFERASYYSARGQEALARELLETGLAASPNQCGLLYSVHRARRNDLDLKGADEAARLLAGCGLSSRLARIEHLAERGEAETAIEELAALVEARPTRLGQRARLAELLVSEGRLAEAKDELSAMRYIRRYSPGLLQRLADVLARLGDDEGAARLRRDYLAVDPGSLGVRRALAFQEGGELLDWAALDLEAAIEAYQSDEERAAYGTDAVLVVDHAGAEVFADNPHRLVVVERVQMVTKLLTKQGLDRHGEVSVPPGAEIVALHTRKADGRVFEPEATPHKDTITLAGLEIGDFVVFDYIVAAPVRSSAMPGWAANPFYVQVYGMPLHSVSYVARAPVEAGLEVEARNVDVDDPVERDGYLVFAYEDSEVPAVLPEHDSPGADEILRWIRVGSGSSPSVYGDIWGDFVTGRAKVDHEVRRFMEAAMSGLSSEVREDPRALTHALAEVVSKSVLGQTASTRLSDRASHILARGRGNRLLVTRAVLNAAGIDSRIALVRPFDADPEVRRFPAGDLYRYAVLRVEPGDGGPPVWIDQNVRTAPIGTLRPLHAGRPAILLAEPGRPTELVTTPEVPRVQESRRSILHLDIDEQGNLRGEGIDTYTGFWGAMVRSGMAQADGDRRRQAVEGSLSQAFGPIRLTTLSFEGAEEDSRPGKPMVVRYEFEVDGWARVRGGVIEAPGGALFPALVSRRLVRLSERRLPMLLQTETVRQLEATFSLPEGYTLAEQPAALNLRSPAGSFQRTVEEGPEGVVVREHLDLELTRVAPGAYRHLVDFASAIDRAQAAGLAFEERVAEGQP